MERRQSSVLPPEMKKMNRMNDNRFVQNVGFRIDRFTIVETVPSDAERFRLILLGNRIGQLNPDGSTILICKRGSPKIHYYTQN